MDGVGRGWEEVGVDYGQVRERCSGEGGVGWSGWGRVRRREVK